MDEQKKKLQDNELENVNGGQNSAEERKNSSKDVRVSATLTGIEQAAVLDPEYSFNS